MTITYHKKKIDKIISKLKNKILKHGYYENLGQSEIRKYKDNLKGLSYSDECEVMEYFNKEVDNL